MDSVISSIGRIISSERKITKFKKKELEETLILEIEYEEEYFLIMIKKAFEKFYVINASNPVNFSEIKSKKNSFEISNDFNSYAIGSKCVTVDGSPEKFIFSREEIISEKETKDKKLVLEKMMFALYVVMEAPRIFLSMDDNNEEENN